ncbi:MAG: GNAT family N-acetyltransferase [Hyphomicrobiaceae bacterium]
MTLRVESLTGAAVRAAIPELARLRVIVFREWPYLYDGTIAYETAYLRRFAASKDAVVVAAYDGDAVVGVATGAPLSDHAEAFGKAFTDRGLDIDRIFYCGESVLLSEFRGLGLGHAFFDGREAHACALGRFTHVTFCGVVRPDDHPLKPKDYRPLDAFWMKRGYAKADGLTTTFAWKDIDQPGETEKLMQFWIKAL